MQSRWRWWLVASVMVHASLLSIAVVTIPRVHIAAVSPPPTLVEVDAPQHTAPEAPGAVLDRARVQSPDIPPPPNAVLGGARSAQNLAAEQRGELGDGQSPQAGRLLAVRADGVNLDPHLLNNLGALQEQRIRSSRTRASPQDDRRTPHPEIDPWLATGNGVLLFRAPMAVVRPDQGAEVPPGIAAADGVAPQPEALTTVRPTPWGSRARVAAGVMDDVQGRAHRAAGPSAQGRPPLEIGHPSTTADIAARHPDDDQDASLLAATLSRSYVAASIQDGPRRAEGSGGVGGGGAPGVGGGIGRGGLAHPLGEGDGWLSLSSDDDRYVQYFHEVRRRLDPLWAHAFPQEDILQLHQGTVSLAFVIEPDGTIANVSVVRRSGVAVFDANVRDAIASAHVPPIPASLGRSALHIRHSFQYRNPVVR